MYTKILEYCKNVAFGNIKLSKEEDELYSLLNEQLLTLCRGLPESVQNNATIFLIEYSRYRFGEPFHFFEKFYMPTWTIIYHIASLKKHKESLTKEEFENAISAQAMAMFLHSLDDHLNDNELDTTHLLLLIRSQAYIKMLDHINKFCNNINDCNDIINNFINDYYQVMCNEIEVNSYNDYCERFRKEISTWYIIPTLTAKKLNLDIVENMLKAFQSFGIAWRLLDDLNDFEDDLFSNTKSALYYSLPEKGKEIWSNAHMNIDHKEHVLKNICKFFEENKTIEKIRKRICDELDLASKYSNECNMHKLSEQYYLMKHNIKIFNK